MQKRRSLYSSFHNCGLILRYEYTTSKENDLPNAIHKSKTMNPLCHLCVSVFFSQQFIFDLVVPPHILSPFTDHCILNNVCSLAAPHVARLCLERGKKSANSCFSLPPPGGHFFMSWKLSRADRKDKKKSKFLNSA